MAAVRRCLLKLPNIPRDVQGVLGLLVMLMTVVMLSMGDCMGLVMLGLIVYWVWRLWQKIQNDD